MHQPAGMNKNLLEKTSITRFELLIWLIFFLLLLFANLADMEILENSLLILGLGIGILALVRVILLSKNYQEHPQEIKAWIYRFCVFKVVPLFLPLVAPLL